MFWFTARSQYNLIQPSKVSTLRIPETDLTISLFRKQRPRAMSHEGEYRILEVSGPSRSNLYLALQPTYAGDNPNLKAYWFPTNRCLKVVDSGARRGPNESLVFLDSATVVHLHEGGDGVLLATEPEAAMRELQFPSASAQFSMSFTKPKVLIPEGDGVLVGILEEPQPEENRQPPPAGSVPESAPEE